MTGAPLSKVILALIYQHYVVERERRVRLPVAPARSAHAALPPDTLVRVVARQVKGHPELMVRNAKQVEQVVRYHVLKWQRRHHQRQHRQPQRPTTSSTSTTAPTANGTINRTTIDNDSTNSNDIDNSTNDNDIDNSTVIDNTNDQPTECTDQRPHQPNAPTNAPTNRQASNRTECTVIDSTNDLVGELHEIAATLVGLSSGAATDGTDNNNLSYENGTIPSDNDRGTSDNEGDNGLPAIDGDENGCTIKKRASRPFLPRASKVQRYSSQTVQNGNKCKDSDDVIIGGDDDDGNNGDNGHDNETDGGVAAVIDSKDVFDSGDNDDDANPIDTHQPEPQLPQPLPQQVPHDNHHDVFGKKIVGTPTKECSKQPPYTVTIDNDLIARTLIELANDGIDDVKWDDNFFEHMTAVYGCNK